MHIHYSILIKIFGPVFEKIAILDFFGGVTSRPPFLELQYLYYSRNSSVGIATDYRLDSRGSIPGRDNIFLSSIASRPALGPTQPPVQWVPGTLSPQA
jgi:hypothetical protein